MVMFIVIAKGNSGKRNPEVSADLGTIGSGPLKNNSPHASASASHTFEFPESWWQDEMNMQLALPTDRLLKNFFHGYGLVEYYSKNDYFSWQLAKRYNSLGILNSQISTYLRYSSTANFAVRFSFCHATISYFINDFPVTDPRRAQFENVDSALSARRTSRRV